MRKLNDFTRTKIENQFLLDCQTKNGTNGFILSNLSDKKKDEFLQQIYENIENFVNDGNEGYCTTRLEVTFHDYYDFEVAINELHFNNLKNGICREVNEILFFDDGSSWEPVCSGFVSRSGGNSVSAGLYENIEDNTFRIILFEKAPHKDVVFTPYKTIYKTYNKAMSVFNNLIQY